MEAVTVLVDNQDTEDLKADWKHIKDFPLAKSAKLLAAQDPELYKSAENQYFLGDATYVLEKLEQRNKTLSENLNVSFFDLYGKIVSTIKDITGLPTSYLSEYPRPGFHIFRGKQTPHPFEYHIDTTICRYDTNYKPEHCYSFLSLIESPNSDPAGLEYKDTNDFDALRDYPEKVKLFKIIALTRIEELLGIYWEYMFDCDLSNEKNTDNIQFTD